MPEIHKSTAIDQTSPQGNGNATSDVDRQTAELEQEIQTQNNPEEVGQRLAAMAYAVRREAFAILKGLALRFTNQPEIMLRLLAGCHARWAKARYTIARDLSERGEGDLALRLYEEAFLQTIRESSDADTLRDAVETGMQLNQENRAAEAMQKLLALAEKDESTISDVASLAYHCAKIGRPHEADLIWQRLLAAWPENKSVQKSYAKFMRESVASPATNHCDEQTKGNLKQCTQHRGDLKSLANSAPQAELLHECEKRIAASADDETVVFWINMTRFIATQHHDMLTANRLWAVILKHAPQHASSFLRFSTEFNTLGQDKETDRLIRYAHALRQATGKPDNKGKRIALKRTSMVNTRALDAIVTIDAIPQTAHQWLTKAGQLVTEQNFAPAFRIWIALLKHDSRLMPAVTRGLVRIAIELPPERVFTDMRVKETLLLEPSAANLYRSVASNINDSHPVVARQILSALHEAKPEDPGNCLALAELLIGQKRFEEAAQLWLPLKQSHANSCAHCAFTLVQKQQHALAQSLYREVAKFSPVQLIKHGYEYFQDPAMSDLVLECIEPILPTGNERHVEQHQVLALKLFLRHGTQAQRVQAILSRLVGSGALTNHAAERILATPPIQHSRQIQMQRDTEIEAYLTEKTPSLQRGQFFHRLLETKPLMNPGKKTDRTTRSVLLHPKRLFDADSPDPKTRRKKGRNR